MLVLVTYDVALTSRAGRARLRRVARACQDFGQRVQYSVFEIEVDPAQWAALKARLESDYRSEAGQPALLLPWGELAPPRRACRRQGGRRFGRAADRMTAEPEPLREPQACRIFPAGSRRP